jgi:PAS domain S-box-containing protein
MSSLKNLDEAVRLKTLREYAVLDTAPEQALDDITALAAQICGTPIALISLVDEHRQWYKSRVGVEDTETSREISICAHSLGKSELFIVPDATLDERFANNPSVIGEPHICFYAGAPLITPEEASLGTLCVIDRVPRVLSQAQKQALQVLARQVMTHLELRRQMVALRMSEERFSNAFEHAPIGMALVSIEGRWLKVNQELCGLLGYTSEELVQKTFQDITHPEDLEPDLKHADDLLAGKITSYHMEKRYLHKQGHSVWVDLGVSLVSDKQNVPLYFISQILDISESKKALARQQELTHKAQAGEKAKSDFLATMSHEIRTPLNGVLGMAGILADTDLDDMQRECVETINTSGESLLAVINDILDYSKIEAGRLEMENRAFNLQQCVEEAFDLFATQIRAKNLEAVYLLSPEIPRHLVGDSMRLRQILVNLIGNAIKFTSKGEIAVKVESTKNDENGCHLLFSVSDTGIGIPRHVIDKLFNAFQQVDSSTTRRYGGTGLGLAICKRLSAIMGGTIWAESEPGVGSKFLFTAVLQPSPTGQGGEPPPARFDSRSVLIVDDNSMNRHMLESQLRSWGMLATVAASGAEALRIMETMRFDVALVDLHMPEMDGVALARKIRAAYPTPLILLTSQSVVGGEADLFQYKLSKPIKHSALFNALLKLTGSPAELSQKVSGKKLDAGLSEKHPLRILLAEDNAINQKVGLLMLSRLGYTAEAVVNGKKAVEALERAKFDVILMDIQMPEMNGIEATSILRATHGETTPVIIALTAEALEGDEKRFLNLGFDFYLSKPLQAELLQQVLRSLQPKQDEESRVDDRKVPELQNI